MAPLSYVLQTSAKLNPNKKTAGNVAVLHDSQAEVLADEN